MTSKNNPFSLPIVSHAFSALAWIGRAILQAYRNRWVRIGFILLLSYGTWKFRYELGELGELVLNQDHFSAYVTSLGLLGPLFLWSLNVAQIIIAVLPGHIIFLTSGYIYGTFNGFLIMYTSTLVAGQLAFLLARYFGRPMVIRFVPAKTLSVWDRIADKNGFMYYLLLLLVPIFPTDVLTYVAGLSKISIPKFTLANIIGRAPWIFFLTVVGALGIDFVVNSLSPTSWVLLTLAILVFVVVYRLLSPSLRRTIIGRQI